MSRLTDQKFWPSSLYLEAIPVKRLDTFANAYLSRCKDRDTIPITRCRAQSLCKNPNALDSDYGLIVANYNSNYLGYIGLVPGYVRINGNLTKILFTNTGFSDPKGLKARLSKHVTDFACELGSPVIAVGNTPIAEKMYRRFKWIELPSHHFLQVKANQFSPGHLFFVATRKVLSAFNIRSDFINQMVRKTSRTPLGVKKFLYWILKRKAGHLIPQCTFREQSRLSPQAKKLIESDKTDRFYRSPEVVNWMLESNWWSYDPQPEGRELDYWFHVPKKSLNYKVINILSPVTDTFLGFAILSIIHHETTTLKVLDYGFVDDHSLDQLIPLVLQYAKKGLVDDIHLPSELSYRDVTKKIFGTSARITKAASCFCKSNDEEFNANIMGVKRSLVDGDLGFW